MDDKFEEHLAGLMDYQTEPSVVVSVADVQAAARRRTRLRATGVAGSALAVALIGVGAAAFAGGGGAGPGTGSGSGLSAAARTGAQVDSAAKDPSPVRHAASGDTIQVAEGLTFTVTDNRLCVNRGASSLGAAITDCRDVAALPARTGGNPEVDVWGQNQGLVAEYLSPQTPARVEFSRGGKAIPATLVSTPGMKDWTAMYVVLPPQDRDGKESFPDVQFTAYDAQGKVLFSAKKDPTEKNGHNPAQKPTTSTTPTTPTTPSTPSGR